MFASLIDTLRTHLRISRLWFRNFVLWLTWELRFFWLLAFPVVLAYGQMFYWDSPEIPIKMGGLTLEFIGIATVAWGLRDTRKFFEKPSTIGQIFGWIKRFPRYRRVTLVPVGMASEINMSDSVTVDLWRNTEPGDPIVKRVEALEVNLRRVKEELRGTQKDINNRLSDQEQSLKDEKSARSESDRKIEEKMERLETGGLHISAIGLVWLMAGMPLTVFPVELAQLVQKFEGLS